MSGLRITNLLCQNPSPMTLEGTNTYVIGDHTHAVVVDPGPADHPEHRDAVAEALQGRRVIAVLLTHWHRDHSGSAVELSELLSAPVRAFAADFCHNPGGFPGSAAALREGEEIIFDGGQVTVLHTPGHTSDSVCFLIPTAQALLTGDTILGSGTTMLDHPDGTLTDYLNTLDRLSDMNGLRMLPGHGPERDSVAELASAYAAHRKLRLDQVRELLARHGEVDATRMGQLIYGDQTAVPEYVATATAAAQLDHLRAN